MEAYREFASVYDLFMEDTPYDVWYQFIKDCVEEEHVNIEKVCELGCGTGQMTLLFAKDGKEVMGIDYSPEMLMVAQDHAYDENVSILYSMQDMTEFELGQKMDLICSCCDSINYLLEEEEIRRTFVQVEKHLTSQGLFVFDMNTAYKYKEVLGSDTFAEQTESAAYIWENDYDEETAINSYEVSFFIKDKEGKYERTIENHYQRAYSIKTIEKILKEAGLVLIATYDNYTKQPVKADTERITYIAKKQL